MIYVRKSCGAVFEGSKKHDPLGSIQHHAKSATCAKAIHAEHLGELRERGVRHKKGSATSSFHNSAATNTLYAVTDPLGTVHALVDSGGTVAVSYTYDSWGNLLSVSGDETLIASLRFTWQGREYSHAAGLYNFRARWYDPAAGRWLSKDPIGLEGGLNLYEAFGNNPVCFGDILGESTVEIISTIGILKLSDPELPDFYNTVKSFPDNSISRLNIYDHGTRIMMNIDGFGSGVSWSGNPEDLIEFDIGLGSLLDLVRSKLVCGAIIGLFGCNTAREFSCCNNDNIARQLSRELPDVFVTGFAGFGVGNELSLWFFGCKRPFIRFGDTTFVTGIKRTYLNGIEVR